MVNILAEYQHVSILKALLWASSRPQTAACMAVDSCYDPTFPCCSDEISPSKFTQVVHLRTI